MIVKGGQREAAMALSRGRMLWGLREKIDPAHTALVVVDMQNDFVAENGLLAREGASVSDAQDMVPSLHQLLSAARNAGVFVIFVRNVYSTEHNFYLSDVWLEQAARKRPGGYTTDPGCPEGGWGGDFYGDIRPGDGEPIVTKHRYNGFHHTDLDLILRSRGVRSIVFTGVSTNCCVETTARDAFMRDYYVIVAADATASYSQESHQMALKNIESLFGEVSTVGQLIDIWRSKN